MSGGLWEFDHEIDAEHIPPCIQNREWLKLANWRVSPEFHLETKIAGTYILADVLRYLRPPVVPGHQFQCLPVSRVSYYLGVMEKGYNLSV